MTEKKENEKSSESKESELRQAPSENKNTSNVTQEDRANYWFEQDPKYSNF